MSVYPDGMVAADLDAWWGGNHVCPDCGQQTDEPEQLCDLCNQRTEMEEEDD